MTKVVIDTSVLVSALLTEHGAEAAVLDGVLDGKLIWCVSGAILAEYEATLHRPKFGALNAGRSPQHSKPPVRRNQQKPNDLLKSEVPQGSFFIAVDCAWA